MTPLQRRAADEAAIRSTAPTGSGGFWIVAGSKMQFANKIWPRGAIVPTELVEQIEHGRLGVMIANRLLAHRLGTPPVPIVQDDGAATRAAQRDAMLRSGYQPWEIDRNIPAPGGAYANPVHPSAAVQPTRLPISQTGGYFEK